MKFSQKIQTGLRINRLVKNWGSYYLDYLKLKKQPYIIKFRNGVRYIIRPGTIDRGLLNEIWANRLYTPKGFEIKEDDTIIDIGAHIGIFSVYAAKKAKNGKVYSFEPSPNNFKVLEQNKKINRQENITLINKGVSDIDGDKEIFLCNGNTGGHSFFKTEGDYNQKIIIPTVSLESFVNKNKIKSIDFLKMDCEGAEYEILFQLSKKTIESIKKISMEYHNLSSEKNGKTLKEFLEKNGFKVKVFTGKDTRLYAWR